MNFDINFFQDAMKYDKMIYDLAFYDVTDGMILIPNGMEDVLEIQKKVANKFNYFKRLIQSGEMTYMDLNRSVTARCGPFNNANKHLTDDEMIEEVTTSLPAPSPKELNMLNPFSSLFSGLSSGNIKIIPLDNNFLTEMRNRNQGNVFEDEDAKVNEEKLPKAKKSKNAKNIKKQRRNSKGPKDNT